MKKYSKDILEDLTNEELEQLMTYTNQEFTKENIENIKKNIKRGMEPSKKTKKRKYGFIFAAAAALMLLVGYTQRNALQIVYIKYFGTDSQKLLLNADKLNLSVEDKGLRLTAKTTFKDGDDTYFVSELTDLKEDRLSEDTSIDDWEMLNGGNTQVVDYDKKNKTATLVTHAVSWNDGADTGFQLKRFTSHRKEFNEISSIDVGKFIQKKPEWTDISDQDGKGGGFDPKKMKKLKLDFDELSNTALKSNVIHEVISTSEKVYLHNAAYKDNLLHLLIESPNDLKHSALFVELVNKTTGKSKKEVASFGVDYGTHNNTTGRSDYTEYVFDVTEKELVNYQIKIDGWNNQTIVEGNWPIRLEDVTTLERKKLANYVDKEDGIKIKNILVSPLSISFDSELKDFEHTNLVIELLLKDGTKKVLLDTKNKNDNEQTSIITGVGSTVEKYILNYGYIELSDIQSLIINGTEQKL